MWLLTSMISLAAHKIKAFREAFGLTQAQFGARFGVNKQRVYKWETGLIAFPSKAIINKLHDDDIVDRHDWFETVDGPLLCATCERRLRDPVVQGCTHGKCPRQLFQIMEKVA
jgi:transcriptional regulator with XRE-family HTH domain